MSLLTGCSDSCGWVAAMVALLCYGTYGVPIKTTAHLGISVNPLVFQTYKTVVMLFVAPVLVLLLTGGGDANKLLRLTPGWGFLSGLLWVLGGTCGVVAVRWAGMSTAIATWASVMIMVNFVWGILVFHEPVANLRHTMAAFVLLAVGLVGMSHFAAPKTNAVEFDDSGVGFVQLATEEENEDGDDGDIQLNRSVDENEIVIEPQQPAGSSLFESSGGTKTVFRRTQSSHEESSGGGDDVHGDAESDVVPPSFNAETHVRVFRNVIFTKRLFGIGAAVANGVLAGSSLIPVHYAKQHGFGGANYMMSYAVGAFTANLIVWLVYYMVLVLRLKSLQLSIGDRLLRAAGDMPDPHFEELFKPGLCAGLLLATAMFGSILAVTYLGQGIGNSVIQAKIMVSGIWGIYYYKEIRDPKSIRNWFLSALLSVLGIIWLSRERIAATTTNDNHHRILLLSPDFLLSF